MVRLTSRFVAVSVFLLLVAGALVTSTESGLAVPDWPLSYGMLMPPMVGGILYEHGHRMIAAAVSSLVGLQVAVLWRLEKRRLVRRLGYIAFAAILAQALLGGLTVIFLLPPAVSSAHAGLAQIVFALCAVIALLSSRTFGEEPPQAPPADAPFAARALRVSLVATGAIYVQILLGAVVRHTGAGLAIPDFPLVFGRVVPPLDVLGQRGVPIHLAHRLFAVVVAVLVLVAASRLRALSHVHPLFSRLALLWTTTLVAQVLLGAASIWTKKAVVVTVAHLAVGALVWVLGVLACVVLARTAASTPWVKAVAPPEGLPA